MFFENSELKQLYVFAKHPLPLMRQEILDEDEIDISELELSHYRITKRVEHELRGRSGRTRSNSGVGTGKPHAP